MTGAFDSSGGVQLVNRNMIKALAMRTEWQADFFSLMDSAGDGRYHADRPFHGFAGNKARFSVTAARALLSRKYDLLLVTHLHLAALAVLWDSLVRRPYLLMTHGVEVWKQLPWEKRRALRRATIVLTNSRYTQSRICAMHGIGEDRARVLPLCPDYFWPDSPPVSSNDSDPLLLTVGRILKGERYKGHDAVIRALPKIAAGCPGVLYAIIGGGDDQEHLRSLAMTLGVADRVQLTGPVPVEALQDYYRKAAVFLMPSRGEGFGLVYLEAMRFRKPCIAGSSDAGGEVVLNGITGFTADSEDPNAVAEAALRLLLDPELRRRMGEAGYQRMQSEYNFHRFSEALYSAVESALGA